MTEENQAPILSGWRFKLLITVVICSVIGYILFTGWAGWDKVADAFEKVGFSGFALLISLSLFAYSMRFLRWQLFLKSANHTHIPFFKSLRIYLSGFALSITPGKTGEAVRSIFLKDYNIPYRQSFGFFLSERVSDVLSVILIASAGLWYYCEARPIVLFFLCLTSLLLVLASRDKWIKQIEEKLKAKLPEHLSHYPTLALETIVTFRNCFTPKLLFFGILLGMIAWGTEGFACYLILRMLDHPLPLYTVEFIYSFALLVGAITFLPGGLGGAEFTMAKLFLLNGVPPSTTVTVTLLIRISTLWFSVILGLIVIPKSKDAKI